MSDDPYEAALESFSKAHGLRRAESSVHNLARLFRTGGAKNDRVYPLITGRGGPPWSVHTISGDFDSAFDHWSLWLRDRNPVLMIGHPYNRPKRHDEIYEAIRSLGLSVVFPAGSMYGFGTYTVAAVAPTIAVEDLFPELAGASV